MKTSDGIFRAWLVLLAIVFLPAAFSAEVSWTPEEPGRDDLIRVNIAQCKQAGVIHWGVNAKGHDWEEAMPAYRAPESEMDGVATRTPLPDPDSNGISMIMLGPFNNTQEVGSIDFVLQWDDGSWEKDKTGDFQIPIFANRITVQPEKPALNNRIAVTVHRSAPGGQLRWGVNTGQAGWAPPHETYRPDNSTPSRDGLAIDSPVPPPNENGNSTMYLGPFNQGEQVVTSLHMAVHWGADWDTDSGRNYNVPISLETGENGPWVNFISPPPDSLHSSNVMVSVALRSSTFAHLWLDGTPLVTLLAPPFEWQLDLSNLNYGPHILTTATGPRTNRALARTRFWRMPPVRIAAPPAGLRRGATTAEDNTVSFALYAPGKKFVSVIGDFNNWNPDANLMNVSTDGVWWTRLQLEPGTHTYQYLLEGRNRIADPCSRDVEWKDAAGEEAHIPAMARTVLQVGNNIPYVWHDQDFQRPALRELLIYEFFIHDLCPGEGFTGVVARLDYIKDLGVNAIEPLPWTEYPGDVGWGYNPSFHFAPESHYGSPADLKHLIDEAHQRGLAVIMDTVLNHMDGNAPLHQLYGKDYDASPYFHLFLGENWGMPDLDQESEVFKEYIAEVIDFWITEYHIDGTRYDATRWVGWEGYKDWGASWFAWAAHKVDPHNYQIAEHLPIDPELMNTTEMDAGWHAHFRWRLREMITKAELDANEFHRIMTLSTTGFTNAFQRMTYTESHDEERIIRELLEAGYTTNEAIRRAQSALAITITAAGIPMIYAGQEFGESTPKVVGTNALHWSQLESKPYRRLHDATRRLGRLKTTNPALQSGHISILVNNSTTDTAVYERRSAESSVIVAVNFGREIQNVTFPLPSAASWTDLFSGKTVTSQTPGSFTLNLRAGETAVLAGAFDSVGK